MDIIQAALTTGLALDLLTYLGGQHAFDTQNDARAREIIAHTLAFIRARFA